MKYPKIPLAQTVIQLCKANNIHHIVISPGSRNAPLTLGFTNDPFFKCYSIVDERSAAFFALGIAQQIDKPVAVVCTSGSALLNYYPAVSEAYFSEIPLLVISADRPKHLQNIGDGQTINQEHVFENHILCSANLKLDVKASYMNSTDNIKTEKCNSNTVWKQQAAIQEYNENSINQAINIAKTDRGPVHVNVPFDEPLYDFVDHLSIYPQIESKLEVKETLDLALLNSCIDVWNASTKKMILVGVHKPNAIDQLVIDSFASDPSVIVLTETTSNLHHPSFIRSIDQLIAPLASSEFEALKPDILLTFGGLIVSKKIKSFLRQYQPQAHWHISETRAYDTFFSLTEHIKNSPNIFLNEFTNKTVNVESNYRLQWNSLQTRRLDRHKTYVSEIPFSDFKAFHHILNMLPTQSNLQVGNSSAIRYAQLFDIDPSIKVFCNRGTSGIDGSTSTAIGAAVASDIQTTFISGDLSFFYDSNALWNAYVPNNFRIIVINNGGGGIFRILPGYTDTDDFNTYFETQHDLNAKQLCEMYHIGYTQVFKESELKSALSTFYDVSTKPMLLEIMTKDSPNGQILLEYFKFIK